MELKDIPTKNNVIGGGHLQAVADHVILKNTKRYWGKIAKTKPDTDRNT